MKVKGNWELVWMAIAMVAVLISLIVVISRADRDPQAQLELKSQRLERINAMRLALSAASEEQNCAVLSASEQTSKSYIESASIEIAAFEQNRSELAKLVPKRNVEVESMLSNRVDETFLEFQSISDKISNLALQSSNRKAYALAFGPALELLHSMDSDLAKVTDSQADSPSPTSFDILKKISNARLSGYRIQVLLMPHIAEPSNGKMDELEKKIADEDQVIQQCLVSLGSTLGESAVIAKVETQYAEFKKIKSEIIRLSRENSDLRSVALALNEKRKAMLACQDALSNLEKAIRAEQIEIAIPKGRSE